MVELSFRQQPEYDIIITRHNNPLRNPGGNISGCIVDMMPEINPEYVTDDKNYLSTTALAKKYKIRAKALYTFFDKNGWIEYRDRLRYLTPLGIANGGRYKTHNQQHYWVVWPPVLLDQDIFNRFRTRESTITSPAEKAPSTMPQSDTASSNTNTMMAEVDPKHVTDDKDFLSTTALAKKYGIRAKALYNFFVEIGWTVKIGNFRYLTPPGLEEGGKYKTKNRRHFWAVWPPDVLDREIFNSLKIRESDRKSPAKKPSGEISVAKYTEYTSEWSLDMVISYLLKYYFKNQPTSNKQLSETFWKLMGKDISFDNQIRWSSGKHGVPFRIHRRSTILGILKQVPPPLEQRVNQNENSEYPFFYILGENGESAIRKFLLKHPKRVIDQEIKKYLSTIRHPRFFTQFWYRTTFQEIPDGHRVSHIIGNQFVRNGVQSGDNVYIITFAEGQLYVGTRLHAETVVSKQQIQQGEKEEYAEWNPCDHVIMPEEHAPVFKRDCQVTEETANLLQLASGERLLPKNFRGVRQITEYSAKILDEALEAKTVDSTPSKNSDLNPHYFTHFWANSTWANQRVLNEETGEKQLCHSASNGYRFSGVMPGDYVYIITVIDKKIRLGTRLFVDQLVNQRQAEEYFQDENLWEARDHIIMSSPQTIEFDTQRIVPYRISKQLQTISGKPFLPSNFRGVQQITKQSAILLDSVLLSSSSESTSDKIYEHHIAKCVMYDESESGYELSVVDTEQQEFKLTISNIPDSIRDIFDLRQLLGNTIPSYIPQFEFTTRGSVIHHTKIVVKYTHAFAYLHDINHQDFSFYSNVPGITGELFLYPKTEQRFKGAGFYVINVYPAIPTNPIPASQTQNTWLIKICPLQAEQVYENFEAFIHELEQNDGFKKRFIERLTFDLQEILGNQEKLNISAFERELNALSDKVASFDESYHLELSTDLAKRASALTNTYFEAQVNQLPFCILDLESDGETIREIAITDGKNPVSARTDGDIAGLLHNIARNQPGEMLWVGHNIKAWDIPILQRHGLDLHEAPCWDTLRVEALLSPRLSSYALKTSHKALEDVEITHKLFINQLLRILNGWNDLKDDSAFRNEIAFPFIEPYLSEVFSVLRYHHVLPERFLSSLDQLLNKRNTLLGFVEHNELNRTIQDILGKKITDMEHVVIPDFLRPSLRNLPDVKFIGEHHDPYAFEVCLEKITEAEFQQGSSYGLSLLRNYYYHCLRENAAPVPALIPEWSKRYLESQRDLADYVSRTCVISQNWYTRAGLYCFSAEYYLQGENLAQLQEYPPDRVLLVYPELSASCTKTRILTLHQEQIADIFDAHHLWAKFASGQSYLSLSDHADIRETLLKESGTAGEAVAHLNNFWIEKTAYGEYVLWGNTLRIEQEITRQFPKARIQSLPCDTLHEARRKTAIHAVILNVPDERQSDMHSVRLNPETRYRDRYWTMQSLLIQQLVHGKPAVLFLSSSHETKPLENFFKALGFYIPGPGTVRRRLERLHASSNPRKLLIAAIDDFHAVVAQNPEPGLHLLVDALPLQEQWVLNPSIGSTSVDLEKPQQGIPDYGLVCEETSETEYGENADAPEDDNADITTEASQLLLRHDTLSALQAVLPLLRLMQNAAADNAVENALIVLDPRLQTVHSLQDMPELSLLEIPYWTPEDFETRLTLAQQHIRCVQPDSALALPPDDVWRDTLQNIFLKGKGPHNTVGTFTDEQTDYLRKILARRHDILVDMPTGGGKSVLFQAPSLYRGLRTNRLTLVISPLKALMVDQVESLWSRGFWSSVDAITGDVTRFEVDDIYRRLAGGELIMVFVAPERFRSRRFLRALEYRLTMDGDVEYWVFDEAHCISQWGLDFRPDYRHALEYVHRTRKKGESAHPPCIFLSATVTEQVFQDMQQKMS